MAPRLTAVCLVTNDVERLGRFYETVLGLRGEGDSQYFYFRSDTFQLSMFPTRGMEEMAPGSTADSGTGRCVLEFEVENVDAEHARLAALGVEIVKPPATYSWGLRSVWFRDPDGNIVDFLAPAGS